MQPQKFLTKSQIQQIFNIEAELLKDCDEMELTTVWLQAKKTPFVEINAQNSDEFEKLYNEMIQLLSEMVENSNNKIENEKNNLSIQALVYEKINLFYLKKAKEYLDYKRNFFQEFCIDFKYFDYVTAPELSKLYQDESASFNTMNSVLNSTLMQAFIEIPQRKLVEKEKEWNLAEKEHKKVLIQEIIQLKIQIDLYQKKAKLQHYEKFAVASTKPKVSNNNENDETYSSEQHIEKKL